MTPTLSVPVMGAQCEGAGKYFTAVLVGSRAMKPGRREYVRLGLSLRTGAAVVLVSKLEDGALELYGDSALVASLRDVDLADLPWTRLHLPAPTFRDT